MQSPFSPLFLDSAYTVSEAVAGRDLGNLFVLMGPTVAGGILV